MLPTRDHNAEKDILLLIKDTGMNFAVLQPDWMDTSHGDIDLVLDCRDWGKFVTTINEHIVKNKLHLVKAYEIEYGVVCLVILTAGGTVFLDVAIDSYCKEVFGLHLNSVIKNSNKTNKIPVINESDFNTYREKKKEFKRSTYKKVVKKLLNSSVIVRRLIQCTVVSRGMLIYIPYIVDTEILKTNIIIDKVSNYLLITLLEKYNKPPIGHTRKTDE